MVVQLPLTKKQLPCFGSGFRIICLLLFTPQQLNTPRSFLGSTWERWPRMKGSDGCLILKDCWGTPDWWSSCIGNGKFADYHINESVMANLSPRYIRLASRWAVFLASSRPLWARPSHTRLVSWTASFRLHLTVPKTLWYGTLRLIHLAIMQTRKNKLIQLSMYYIYLRI